MNLNPTPLQYATLMAEHEALKFLLRSMEKENESFVRLIRELKTHQDTLLELIDDLIATRASQRTGECSGA